MKTGRPIPDHHRAVNLNDVGLAGYVIAPCVAPDGTDQVWLIDTNESRNAIADDPAFTWPHELAGRLPVYMRDRIWGDELRCGRPGTHTGRPCRRRVGKPGDNCPQHRGLRDGGAI